MQNAKCKMISGIFACTYDTEKACHPEELATKDLRITFGFAVNKAIVEKHLQSKYLNFAFCILHFAFCILHLSGAKSCGIIRKTASEV